MDFKKMCIEEKLIHPDDLDINVGKLEIRCMPGSTGPKLGVNARITIDGEPVYAKAITLRIVVDEVISATLEYYP